ncbi:MAG: flavodoxin family protein [Candidatus Kerfeldbacteria bacterium]|nr:flavodoxin family protein [Candidatus Kerfeldbacteria bacterium]
MKTLVIFDSQFGNTQKIAEAIKLGLSGDVLMKRASDVLPEDFTSLGILVVGSPTQGGRATQAVQACINALPAGSLKDVRVAAFDTRFNAEKYNIGYRLILRTVKYAAQKIAKDLESKGGQLIIKPEGFFVSDKEGPLADGELDRAKAWGAQLVQ